MFIYSKTSVKNYQRLLKSLAFASKEADKSNFLDLTAYSRYDHYPDLKHQNPLVGNKKSNLFGKFK